MINNELLVYKNNFKTIGEMFDLDSKFHIIAGPCAIENFEQMEQVAQFLIENNLNFIRGSAYKPRTSPYDFQGLELEGLKILDYVRKKYKLKAVSEIMDTRDVETALNYIDIIQIGSRNMHNYSLLKEVGKTKHPIILKRGMMATIKEFLYAAEYIISNGNQNIILCERGIRTFEDSTRNTLDIACIAIIKQETSLPIIADLSHSLGRTDIVLPILTALYGIDTDGIMIEVHPDPQNAKSDKQQQLDFKEFKQLLNILSV